MFSPLVLYWFICNNKGICISVILDNLIILDGTLSIFHPSLCLVFFGFVFGSFFFCCMLLPLVIFANNYYQVFPDPQLVKKYHKETISIGTSNLTLKCEGKLSFSPEFSCVVLLTKVKPGTASPDIPNTFSGGVLHLKNARRDLGMDFGYGHLMKYSKYAL